MDPSSSQKMNAFFRKIEAERVVLDVVNRRFDEPLHGLTTGAISDWSHRAEAPVSFVTDLSEVGQAIGSMCERSGERVDAPHRVRLSHARQKVRAFEERYRGK
jgi:hypothetical protein